LCKRAWLILSRGDQIAQVSIDEHTPNIGAIVVTFIRRYQAKMRDVDLGFAILLRDFERNIGIIPLGFGFCIGEIAIQHVADDFFPGTNSVIFILHQCISGAL